MPLAAPVTTAMFPGETTPRDPVVMACLYLGSVVTSGPVTAPVRGALGGTGLPAPPKQPLSSTPPRAGPLPNLVLRLFDYELLLYAYSHKMAGTTSTAASGVDRPGAPAPLTTVS